MRRVQALANLRAIGAAVAQQHLRTVLAYVDMPSDGRSLKQAHTPLEAILVRVWCLEPSKT